MEGGSITKPINSAIHELCADGWSLYQRMTLFVCCGNWQCGVNDIIMVLFIDSSDVKTRVSKCLRKADALVFRSLFSQSPCVWAIIDESETHDTVSRLWCGNGNCSVSSRIIANKGVGMGRLVESKSKADSSTVSDSSIAFASSAIYSIWSEVFVVIAQVPTAMQMSLAVNHYVKRPFTITCAGLNVRPVDQLLAVVT